MMMKLQLQKGGYNGLEKFLSITALIFPFLSQPEV
jgi:hypothetical protein